MNIPYTDIKRIEDYDPTPIEDFDNGNEWAVYRVLVETIDGEFVWGCMQGDTHTWAKETFEQE